MKTTVLISTFVFLVSINALAESNISHPKNTPKHKTQFCSQVDQMVYSNKIRKLEPSWEIDETNKSYNSIDIDKDGTFDEVKLGCGSSGECMLDISLSSGTQFDLSENLMFYLVRINSEIYVPVILGDKVDLGEGSSITEAYSLRKKRLAKLYKLTPEKATLVCKF